MLKYLFFILLGFAPVFVLGQQHVEWTDLRGIDPVSQDRLKKTASDGWSNAGAASLNVLDDSKDGFVQYIIKDSVSSLAFGFSVINVNEEPSTINYGIIRGTRTAYIIELGVTMDSVSLSALGDTLTIERKDSVLLYSKNSTLIYVSGTNYGGPLIVDISIYHYNNKPIGPFICDFKRKNENIIWTENMIGLAIDTLRLNKTDSSGWDNNGASSETILPDDQEGWIELKVEGLDQYAFGFSAYDTGNGYLNMSHAFILNSGDNHVYIAESGDLMGDYGEVFPGDILRIERYDGDILYIINGSLVLTSSIMSSGNIHAAASVFYYNDHMPELRSSFARNTTINTEEIVGTEISETLRYKASGHGVNSQRYGVGTNQTYVPDLPSFGSHAKMEFDFFDVGDPEDTINVYIDYDYNGHVTNPRARFYNPGTANYEAAPLKLTQYHIIGPGKISFTPALFEIWPKKKNAFAAAECDYGSDRNYVDEKTYDGNGTLISEQKVFSDFLGREVQRQQRIISSNNIVAVQTVYDRYGRAAIHTLPAPISAMGNGSPPSMSYKTTFITRDGGNVYSYRDFDQLSSAMPSGYVSQSESETFISDLSEVPVSLVENPMCVEHDASNTLGRYYSNDGMEKYIATTCYPYTRTEYNNDPLQNEKRIAAAGDEYHMGSGHESRVFSMVSPQMELQNILGSNTFLVKKSSSDNLTVENLGDVVGMIGNKNISVDADGAIRISYTCGGNMVASCRSGVGTAVCSQVVNNYMDPNGTQSIDIHLPKSKLNTLQLPLPEVSSVPIPVNDIEYNITDLDADRILSNGFDYILNSDRSVTFLHPCSGFLRISFNYTYNAYDDFLETLYDMEESAPYPEVDYELDYTDWTINYYDIADRLRKACSPLEFLCPEDESPSPGMFTTYDYSREGFLIASHSPDKGTSQSVFDSQGKVRFTQNALQADQNKFSYVNYDIDGRPLESGEYLVTDGLYFQNYYGEPVGAWDGTSSILEDLNGLDAGSCNERSFVAYDDLESGDQIPSGYSYVSSYPQHGLMGRVSKKWNDNSAFWYSYNNSGQLLFSVEQILDNDFSSSVDDQIKTIDYEYLPENGLLRKQIFQKNNTDEVLTHRLTYDDDLRLKEVETATYTSGYITQAKYYYYLNGALKRKELGGNLQGVDYVYTVNGQLKSINHPTLQLEDDPGSDGDNGTGSEETPSACNTDFEHNPNNLFSPDLFGMTIDYHPGDYKRSGRNIFCSSQPFAVEHYNGLISATRYKTKEQTWSSICNNASKITRGGLSSVTLISSSTDMLMNQYIYDYQNRLSTNIFGVAAPIGESLIFTSRKEYNEYGGSDDGGISYDANGNILNLIRNAYSIPVSGVETVNHMDDIDYTYTSNTNRLSHANENATAGPTGLNDFAGAYFTYDLIGQLTESPDENVSGIVYSAAGKVKQVTTTSSEIIDYFYDACGNRMKSRYTNSSSVVVKTTWYVTDVSKKINAIYIKDGSSAVALTEQPIYGAGRLGVISTDGYAVETNYELTDHLGNVRVTFKDDGSGVAQITNWADYYAFGGKMPGRSFNGITYRFDYQGQEHCEQSKWENFELRMFNSDLGRWLSPDPAGQFYSPYLGMGNNPISGIDPDGGYMKPGQNSAAFIDNQRAIRKYGADREGPNWNKALYDLWVKYSDHSIDAWTYWELRNECNAYYSKFYDTQWLYYGRLPVGYEAPNAKETMNHPPGGTHQSVSDQDAYRRGMENDPNFVFTQQNDAEMEEWVDASLDCDRYMTMGNSNDNTYSEDDVSDEIDNVDPCTDEVVSPEEGNVLITEPSNDVSNHIIYQRTTETDQSTTGTFSIPGTEINGYILEPAGPSTTQSGLDRRIPAGTYELIRNEGTKYGLRLYNNEVPQSRAILIHIGNYPGDTAGCLLPGRTVGLNNVGDSGTLLRQMMRHFDQVGFNGATITIYDINNP